MIFFRPGFTRLNLSFFATDDEIEYVLNAVQFVASEGWKFLPLVNIKKKRIFLLFFYILFSILIILLQLDGLIVVVFN